MPAPARSIERVRAGVIVLLTVLSTGLCACGSETSKPAEPPKVSSFQLPSKLMGRPLDQVLVTPAGGGEGRLLLVFLHGYGATGIGTLSPAFARALRRLGDDAPVVLLPEGDVGWWHDRRDGRWGSYVLQEAIPAALARSGADPDRVAVGGISMGGFGALDLGRNPGLFCAVGGHSPAVYERGSSDALFPFDDQADLDRHDLLTIASKRSPYDAPVWLDVGDADALRPAVAKLAKELGAQDADVGFHVSPGSHDGDYWDAHFAEYLKFYADACD
jgi:S-formylglutathione hydrolase FrmB